MESTFRKSDKEEAKEPVPSRENHRRRRKRHTKYRYKTYRNQMRQRPQAPHQSNTARVQEASQQPPPLLLELLPPQLDVGASMNFMDCGLDLLGEDLEEGLLDSGSQQVLPSTGTDQQAPMSRRQEIEKELAS